jgi:signal transduction histidine kinase
MTRRSKAGGKASKGEGRKAPAPGRAISPAAMPGVHSATAPTGNEAEIARLTRERDEALERETAMAHVLRVIRSSSGDLVPVFNAMVENALRLCEAGAGNLFLYNGEEFATAALQGAPPAYAQARRRGVVVRHLNPDVPLNRVIRTKQVIHIVDAREERSYIDRDPRFCELVDDAGARTLLLVPMLQNDDLVGAFAIYRHEVRPFGGKQIALVTTFADQAVIAIENARLFNETKEALARQTATADVLKAISRSAFDLQPVLDALLTSACQLCEADIGTIRYEDGDYYRLAATYGAKPEWIRHFSGYSAKPDRSSVFGQTIIGGHTVHMPDVLADPNYNRPEAQKLMGFRAALGVPLIREGHTFGVINLFRCAVGSFEPRQIEIVETFADQAVIAIENVRLFGELQARTKELASSLDELRAAQDRLVVTEKLASLGQLTAGIAHEIKNPLNFINNFSALSAELVDELDGALRPATLDARTRVEVDQLTGLLKDNLGKVVQHGKRADSIVKNMLLHSREGSGQRQLADINSLLDESLNLAYHGARAEKAAFDITLQRNFDADAGSVELFPQEITRAFLNVITNSFYAMSKRKTENAGQNFEPILSATTKNCGNTIEVRIRDNGNGIPLEVQGKMFNPFFTTKPAGEGTGLGLSMTHDIVVKQHGGRIDVATVSGQFTEFTIVLPRKSNVSQGST